MPLIERTFTVSDKGSTLKVSSLFQKRSPEYLLCIHGIQSNKELFVPLIEQKFFDKYSVLALDCVGFGDSSKPEDFSYNLEAQAHIIHEIIKQLDVKNLHIIGHSLGGVIGTLLLHPLQGICLSFINIEGNLTLSDSGLSKIAAGYSFDEFRNEKYSKIQSDLKQSQEPSASWRLKWLGSIPDYVFYKTSVSLVDWAKSGRLVQLFAEALCRKVYMLGDKNILKKGIIPPGIETIVIPNTGHFMLLDNPTACFSAIESFLLGKV